MRVSELLKEIDLGSSVAEYDEALSTYFLRTGPFNDLVTDKADILAGDKGTGKSAIFKILADSRQSVPELNQIDVLPAFNPAGEPIFQRLTAEARLTEPEYIALWKTYIFSFVGNWLVDNGQGLSSDSLAKVEKILDESQLRTSQNDAPTVFGRVIKFVREKIGNVKSVQGGMTFTPEGIPIFTSKFEFGQETVPAVSTYIRHDEALKLIDECLEQIAARVWVVLDRLDEAFQGRPDIETPALRALLRAYLDLSVFKNFKLKVFLRKDLFRNIVKEGFVNLTHVNARKVEIVWQPEDLLHLLCKRFKQSATFSSHMNLAGLDNKAIFERIFPPKVDNRGGQSNTFDWIMERIRDGNYVRPPRNLIDIVVLAIEEQIRKEERERREYAAGEPIIEPDSLKQALMRLSALRVQDTLIAEVGDAAAKQIRLFKEERTEHNAQSLAELLKIEEVDVPLAIQPLLDIGFLQKLPSTYKVPFLYRFGLDMRQGKAFAKTICEDEGPNTEGEEEEEEA